MYRGRQIYIIYKQKGKIYRDRETDIQRQRDRYIETERQIYSHPTFLKESVVREFRT